MAAEPALRLEGVTKRFGAVTALHEAWLDVAPGEFVTLLGPSGCGKTTLLNLVAGFLEGDGGEIRIFGKPVTHTPVWERDIGLVFQNYALFPHMTVEKNIAYGLKTRGVPDAEVRRRVAEAMELVQLKGMEQRRPRQLSGGQQQRVALARALVIRPKLLLLDEPFSALDRNLRGAMQVELKQIQRSLGITTIFVTHDQGEALSMSDRIAVMSAGRIRQVATAEDIYRKPADSFVASFVGEVNRLPATLALLGPEAATLRLAGTAVEVPAAPLQGLAAGAAAEAFIRPEQLTPVHAGNGALLDGRVAAAIYQGHHLDLYLDTQAGRVLLRLPGTPGEAARYPEGSALGIALREGAEPLGFPA